MDSKKLPYFKEFLDKLLVFTSQGKDLAESMQEVISQTDVSQKEWWEQLLIGEEGLFNFINEKKETFQRYRRIRYLENKVELLPGLRNRTNIKDYLDYGFYCYCERKGYGVADYTCDEKQYGEISQPHFSLNNKEVLCNSKKSIICFGDKEYQIKLKKGTDIFSEFDKVLKLIDEDKNTQ